MDWPPRDQVYDIHRAGQTPWEAANAMGDFAMNASLRAIEKHSTLTITWSRNDGVVLGKGVLENKNSTDIESTDRVRASM
jgi:hypothetical protein